MALTRVALKVERTHTLVCCVLFCFYLTASETFDKHYAHRYEQIKGKTRILNNNMPTGLTILWRLPRGGGAIRNSVE